MPLVSRTFIKTGLVCFVLALLLGGVQWLDYLGWDVGWFAGGPAHVHLFVYGWVTEMIIGVAIWLFPVADRDRPRGRPWLNWTAYAGINLGLLLRVVSEPMATGTAAAAMWNWMLLGSAIAQWIGGVAFVATIWPRVSER
ncbi:MAG: hypothetical protein ABEL76_04285 [Bradymonadaceae bacterium]